MGVVEWAMLADAAMLLFTFHVTKSQSMTCIEPSQRTPMSHMRRERYWPQPALAERSADSAPAH